MHAMTEDDLPYSLPAHNAELIIIIILVLLLREMRVGSLHTCVCTSED